MIMFEPATILNKASTMVALAQTPFLPLPPYQSLIIIDLPQRQRY
jgi:hypothetical protein